MGNFFPRWTNFLPLKIIVALGLVGTAAIAAITVYWTPKYSRVGFMPEQPIPFDHSVHVGQLGMDCRYCHSFVEKSLHSNIPSTQTCYNCHQHIKPESEKLAPLREAMQTGEPIEWVQIHKTPDYAFFSHEVHVNRGVSCQSCHGQVNEMQVVWQDHSQTMGWCLDCHRNPENKLRPLEEITNLDWKPADTSRDGFYADLQKVYAAAGEEKTVEELVEFVKGHGLKAEGDLTQKEIGLQLKEAWGVQPPQSCSACHR